MQKPYDLKKALEAKIYDQDQKQIPLDKEDDTPAQVVDLGQERLDRTPHKYGFARCITCNFEFMAVAPNGTYSLPCPSCKCGAAFFIHPVEASEGDAVWSCSYCGGQAFSSVIRNDVHRFWCCGCASYIEPEEFMEGIYGTDHSKQ